MEQASIRNCFCRQDAGSTFLRLHAPWLIASARHGAKLAVCQSDRSSLFAVEFICLNLPYGWMPTIGVAGKSECSSATRIRITQRLTVKLS